VEAKKRMEKVIYGSNVCCARQQSPKAKKCLVCGSVPKTARLRNDLRWQLFQVSPIMRLSSARQAFRLSSASHDHLSKIPARGVAGDIGVFRFGVMDCLLGREIQSESIKRLILHPPRPLLNPRFSPASGLRCRERHLVFIGQCPGRSVAA